MKQTITLTFTNEEGSTEHKMEVSLVPGIEEEAAIAFLEKALVVIRGQIPSNKTVRHVNLH